VFLLIPLGFGCILANLGAASQHGAFRLLAEAGLQSGLFPILILAGLGTSLDLSPLLHHPRAVFLSAAGQLGIYVPLIFATLLGYSLGDAAAIGMIGAMSWPAAVYVASRLSPGLLPLIAILAYAFLPLVSRIRPLLADTALPASAAGSLPAEAPHPTPGWVLAAFPVGITVLAGIFAPPAAPLVGVFMLGTLLRIAGQDNRLLKIVQNELSSGSLLLLGLAAGTTMAASSMLSLGTLKVLLLGLIALLLDLLGAILITRVTGVRLFDLLPTGNPDSGGDEAANPDGQPAGVRAALQLGAVIAGGVLLAVIAAAG